MKIAMLGQKGIPAIFGGIERHVEELAIRLADHNHEVIVYCRPWYLGKQPVTSNEQRIHRVSIPTIKSKHLDAIVHTFFSTMHALRKNPDIYHYHGVGPSLISWIPRIFRPRARVITTFHCIDRKHQKWGLVARVALRLGEWSACRFAHQTITVSRTLEQYCKDVYETNTSYIPNGIAAPPHTGTTLIKRFQLEPNKYVAMVSRLVRHKGAHYLIRAWNGLQTKHPKLIQDKKLVIVGDSAFTDDYTAELRTLAGTDPSIVFTGYQSGAMLEELFANALFIAHPSESEGLPIAVLEAMSYGKVVVASDIPENMEVVAEHGVPFRNSDVAHLTERMAELLENPNELTALGARAQAFVLKQYHWDDIVKQVEHLYQTNTPTMTARAQTIE